MTATSPNSGTPANTSARSATAQELIISLQTLTALQTQQLETLDLLTRSLQQLLDRQETLTDSPNPHTTAPYSPGLGDYAPLSTYEPRPEDEFPINAAPSPLRAPIGWLFHTLATQTERVEQTHWERGLDRLADVVDSLGLIRTLGSIGNLALLVALLSWIKGGADRRQAQDYQAWSVISSAAAIEAEYRDITAEDGTTTQRIIVGSSGEGGRTTAIEALYNNHVDLAGLKAPGALLTQLDIGQRGSLGQHSRSCWPALPLGCTPAANLYAADFEGTDLYGSNLQGANLKNANLSYALVSASNLQNTDLSNTIVTGADFTGTTLQGANLHQVDFEDAILVGTVLSGVRNLTDTQLAEAHLCGVQLPKGLETPSDRDCDKIAQLLVDRYGWFSTLEEAQAYIDSVLAPPAP